MSVGHPYRELVVGSTEIPSRLTAVPDDNGVSGGQGTCTNTHNIRVHIIIIYIRVHLHL